MACFVGFSKKMISIAKLGDFIAGQRDDDTRRVLIPHGYLTIDYTVTRFWPTAIPLSVKTIM